MCLDVVYGLGLRQVLYIGVTGGIAHDSMKVIFHIVMVSGAIPSGPWRGVRPIIMCYFYIGRECKGFGEMER